MKRWKAGLGRVLAGFLLVASLGLAACSESEGAAPENLSPSYELIACARGPLQGCTQEQMRAYSAGVLNLTWTKYISPFTNDDRPTFLWVPRGVKHTEVKCWDPKIKFALDDDRIQYCPDTNTLYVGESFTWELYAAYGYAMPPLVFAGELSHFLQRQAGAYDKVKDDRQLQLQADCVAGAWWAAARKAGTIDAQLDLYPTFKKYSGEYDLSDGLSDVSPNDHQELFKYGAQREIGACSSRYKEWALVA